MNKYPYIFGVSITAMLVFAYFLGRQGGTDYYQVASDTSRIVQLDEPPVPPSEYDNKLLQMDREAVELAYRHQIENLFAVWMRDNTGQPQRAVNGARKAKKAYIDIMRELDARGKSN